MAIILKVISFLLSKMANRGKILQAIHFSVSNWYAWVVSHSKSMWKGHTLKTQKVVAKYWRLAIRSVLAQN